MRMATDSAWAIEPTAASETVANCRYGATPLGSNFASWIPTLGAGWYLTFSTMKLPGAGDDAQFVPVIAVNEQYVQNNGNRIYTGEFYLAGNQALTGAAAENHIRNLVTGLPGHLWLIGNEVDRVTQGEVTPATYARAYHEIAGWIKDADPSAEVAISGLVEVTPGRLQYLDLVWQAHLQQYGEPMDVDVWNMHLYILPEVASDGFTPSAGGVALGTNVSLAKRYDLNNCQSDDVYCHYEHDDMDIFAEQIRQMRLWMKDHGQQNKPLILSEYSILWPYEDDGGTCFLQDEHGQCFTPARVSSFMIETFDHMNVEAKDANLGYPLDDYRLVQQWMWFSINSGNIDAGSASNLVEENEFGEDTFTEMGFTFRNYVWNESPTQNLLIDHIPNSVAFTDGAATVTSTLSLEFRNNGNTGVSTPISVTFYSNADLTMPIGSTTIDVPIHGCATRATVVAVEWPDLSPGLHRFWVKLDSSRVIDESNESDNVGQGIVLVDPLQILLPEVSRQD